MSEFYALDRRALLQQAFLLAGAVSLPSGAALAQAVKSGPRLLDPARFALLTAIADTIIPKTETVGALDVGVPDAVDALMRDWASPERRIALIAALDEIDALAKAAQKKTFAALGAAERNALLTAHDATAIKHAPKQEEAANVAKIGAIEVVADPQTGRTRQGPSNSLLAGPTFVNPGYGKLKELIVVLYYYSEPALTQELSYEHAPGKWRPSIPITAETRPAGGFGLF